MKFNPFRPNSIASTGLFQERKEEMLLIEQSLFQTKNGNPQHFLVEGERGLGKQEFAFKAFDQDADNRICVEDVKNGAFGPFGALKQLGNKYFNELYFAQIGSDEYRRVLQAMARFSDSWVNREMIKKEILIKDTTLNNAIQALKTRSIIVPNPAQPGEFRLPTKSFAAWIKAFYMLEDEPFLPENRNHE